MSSILTSIKQNNSLKLIFNFVRYLCLDCCHFDKERRQHAITQELMFTCYIKEKVAKRQYKFTPPLPSHLKLSLLLSIVVNVDKNTNFLNENRKYEKTIISLHTRLFIY